MKNIADFKTNHFFSMAPRILGYVLILIGFIGVFTKGFETIIISLIGFGISFTRYGILIDVVDNKLKEYLQLFGIKLGKWQLLKNYPFITVLTITERTTIRSQSNLGSTTRKKVYRITLLSNNHYEKILLEQLNEEEQAHKKAEEYAQLYGFDKVIYSPG